MEELEVIQRLRALSRGTIDPAVAEQHLHVIETTVPLHQGTRPRHLVAAAVAFAVLAAGLATAITRSSDDDPKPVSSIDSEQPSELDSSPSVPTNDR